MNHTEPQTVRTPRTMRRWIAPAVLAMTALAGGSAWAVVTDLSAIDLATMPQALNYNWASNPSPSGVAITLPFTINNRTAYTQAAPLDLPCDVNELSTGVAFRNVSTVSYYAELGGTVSINGDEHNLITNVFGQTEPLAALGVLVAPNTVSAGGYILLALPPLVDYTTSQFPANVPLKIRMTTRAFSNNAYDTSRGGYFLSSQIAENTVWNNGWAVWVRRVCP